MDVSVQPRQSGVLDGKILERVLQSVEYRGSLDRGGADRFQLETMNAQIIPKYAFGVLENPDGGCKL